MESIALSADIQWLKIPFADIFTSVYIVTTPTATVVFDTATKESDVQDYIIPALGDRKPDYIFISHNHNDHSGGVAAMLQAYPNAQVVSTNDALAEQYPVLRPEDGAKLLNVLQVVYIPGHTVDAIGLLDCRTGTLLSGDCMQAYGIYGRGPWGSAIRSIGAHFKALAKLEKMKIATIATAHCYHPYEAVIQKDAIERFYQTCKKALYDIYDIVAAAPELADEELVERCNSRGLPRIDHRVIAGVRKAIEENVF